MVACVVGGNSAPFRFHAARLYDDNVDPERLELEAKGV